MHAKYALLAVTALALVTGCNRGAGNNSAANQSATGNSANAAAPVAPTAAAGGAMDRAFLVGHWGMAGNCSRTVSFNADGTGAATGETGGTWTLEGNTIVLTDEDPQPERMTVARVGDNLSITGGPEGQSMTMTRCATATVAPAGADAPEAADAEGAEASD